MKQIIKSLSSVWFFVFLLLTITFQSCLSEQSTLDPKGPIAQTQYDLLVYITILGTIVFLIVLGVFVYSIIKYRKKDDKIPTQIHGNLKLEIMWTIVPALIIVAIAIPTVQGIFSTAQPTNSEDEPLVVEAIGHQWWFEFRYPTEEIVTANELRIPINKPVVINLYSQDVIHSFWVPKLAGKVDMVPNQETTLFLEADEPGVYYGQCAEFCSVGHSYMRFRVVAMEQAEYDDWAISWQLPPPNSSDNQDVVQGQLLFTTNCSTCHSVDTHQLGRYQTEINVQNTRWNSWVQNQDESVIVSAPNLTHFGERITIGSGVDELNRDNLIGWIKNPTIIKPNTRMQNLANVYKTDDKTASLTDTEIEQIADYLLFLKPEKTEE